MIMGKIKYSYCLNENNELVHISSVNIENRRNHTYRCLECDQEMIAKIGKIKVPHFAHRADTACDGESYLHKLAKRRIREKFMSANRFPLTFKRNVCCKESCKCAYYMENACIEQDISIPNDLKTWKGNVVYDTCQEEVRLGEFQPDLLLTCSTKPNREPVFIEVYKTHLSEEPKLASNYRIIETIKLESEADIDNIIDNGFVEGQNCHTYNFSPELPSIRKMDVPITRFILFGNGNAFVDYNNVRCSQINKRVHPKSIRELNILRSCVDVKGFYESEQKLDSYQIGLIYLVKKGMDIRNCILCKFYKYNEWYGIRVCVLYKSLGEQYHYPEQTTAKSCPKYEKDHMLLNHLISELEKDVSEVPI